MHPVLKFLDPYEKADFPFYFGREKETEALYVRVKANPITLFYGLSGTGKTSLTLCGLSNKFADMDWMPFVIRRGNDGNILARAMEAVRSAVPDAPPESTMSSLLDQLYYENFRTIYLIFDQLEELFIYGDSEEKQAFIKFISDLKAEVHFAKIILILREEFFVHLDEFETKIPEIFRSRVRLSPMKLEGPSDVFSDPATPGPSVDTGKKDVVGLRNVIIAMGKSLGMAIDQDVADDIANHVRVKSIGYQTEADFELVEKKIELPYLQIYFKEIVAAVGDKLAKLIPGEYIQLKKDDLPKLGTINDVLTDYLDACVKEIAREDGPVDDMEATEKNIWRILNTLVSIKGTKQARGLEEIQSILS